MEFVGGGSVINGATLSIFLKNLVLKCKNSKCRVVNWSHWTKASPRGNSDPLQNSPNSRTPFYIANNCEPFIQFINSVGFWMYSCQKKTLKVSTSQLQLRSTNGPFYAQYNKGLTKENIQSGKIFLIGYFQSPIGKFKSIGDWVLFSV